MMRRVIRSCSFAVVVCVIPCLGGCGSGLMGSDDILPGACALGPTPPFKPQIVPSKDATDRMKIYLLRGLANVYSLGLDELATEMTGLGLSATMVDWPLWENTAQQIVSEYGGLTDGNVYVLIGHSYGADDAVRIARYVKDYGIEVQLLFLLDATTPPAIPDNVVLCIQYYEPWILGDLFPGVFSGKPVMADEGNSRTQITNLLFTPQALGEGTGCADHFSIDANQLMHNLILTEVFQLMEDQSDTAGSKAVLTARGALSPGREMR